MSTVPYNKISQNISRTEMYSVVEYTLGLPRSRFLDVTQRSPQRTFSFGGALRDIQKKAARQTNIYYAWY